MNMEEFRKYKADTDEKIRQLEKDIKNLENNLTNDFLGYAEGMGFYKERRVSYRNEKWVIEKATYWVHSNRNDIIWLELVQPNKKGIITNRCKRDYCFSEEVEFID